MNKDQDKDRRKVSASQRPRREKLLHNMRHNRTSVARVAKENESESQDWISDATIHLLCVSRTRSVDNDWSFAIIATQSALNDVQDQGRDIA